MSIFYTHQFVLLCSHLLTLAHTVNFLKLNKCEKVASVRFTPKLGQVRQLNSYTLYTDKVESSHPSVGVSSMTMGGSH